MLLQSFKTDSSEEVVFFVQVLIRLLYGSHKVPKKGWLAGLGPSVCLMGPFCGQVGLSTDFLDGFLGASWGHFGRFGGPFGRSGDTLNQPNLRHGMTLNPMPSCRLWGPYRGSRGAVLRSSGANSGAS